MSLFLAACGGDDDNFVPGSGGSGNGSGTGTPSASQQTLNRGSINGFASVLVNGVYYDEEGNNITINNANAPQSDLRLGMVVDVIGPIDDNGLTGTADTISARSTVSGPVSEVNAAGNSFTVLGTTVRLNDATVLDGMEELSQLNADDRVVVYGYLNEEGDVYATRVERNSGTTASNNVALTGRVSNASDTSFEINGVQVQYNAAAIAGLTNGELTDGMLVRVRGNLADTGTDTGTATDDGTDTGTGPDDGTDTGTGTDDGTDTATGSDGGTDTGTGTDDGTDTGTGIDDGTDTGTGTDDGTDTGTGTGVDDGTDTGTGTGDGTDTGTGTDDGTDGGTTDGGDSSGAGNGGDDASGGDTPSDGTMLTITATEVSEVASLFEDRDGEFTELEGVITSFRSATDFDVNGEPVSVDANAEVSGTPAQDSWVEIEGTVDGETLSASTVQVKTVEEQGEVWLIGTLADLDTGESSFTMRDGNVTVEWNDDTVFDEASLAQGSGSLSNNMRVAVEGQVSGDTITAERVAMLPADGDIMAVTGTVADVDPQAQSFGLDQGQLTVTWDDATLFDEASLPQGSDDIAEDQQVIVYGRMEEDQFIATAIREAEES